MDRKPVHGRSVVKSQVPTPGFQVRQTTGTRPQPCRRRATPVATVQNVFILVPFRLGALPFPKTRPSLQVVHRWHGRTCPRVVRDQTTPVIATSEGRTTVSVLDEAGVGQNHPVNPDVRRRSHSIRLTQVWSKT